MLRPAYNHISKSGKINIIDTRIKRKDVNTAIEQLAAWRKELVSNLTVTQHADDLIMKLPPEIRNKIYDLAFPNNPASTVEPRAPNTQARHSSSSVFRLSKQITLEARSLMESSRIAYIPVMVHMDYTELIKNINHHGLSSMSPAQTTIFTAITTFINVHIHLHVNYRSSGQADDPEPDLDASNPFIYGRLRQLLIIFTSASASMSHHLSGTNTKRTAIVHLDHLFSDWGYMHTFAGCYTMKHLIRIMGDDRHTNWDVRYYVHAGGELKAQTWADWDPRLTRDFERIKEQCDKFTNVKLTAEVYGELTCEMEGKTEGVTRTITPSSSLWSSWPDDVPWRRFERVRSDEAVPVKEDV